MRLVYNFLYYLMYGFLGLISITIIASWIPPLYNLKMFRIFRRVTDTYMQPFHGMLVLGFLDFTPIIGIVLLEFLINAYVGLINSAFAA